MGLQEVYLEPPPKTAILPLLLRLSPKLRLPSPLQLPLYLLMRSYSNSLWKPIWRTRTKTRSRLPLQAKQSFESNCWRLGFSTLIMEILIWTVTAFVSNVRTTLIPPKPAGPTESDLSPRSSVGQWYSIDTNISIALREPRWHRLNSKISTKKTLDIIGLLLTISVVNSDKTLYIKPGQC